MLSYCLKCKVDTESNKPNISKTCNNYLVKMCNLQ